MSKQKIILNILVYIFPYKCNYKKKNNNLFCIIIIYDAFAINSCFKKKKKRTAISLVTFHI